MIDRPLVCRNILQKIKEHKDFNILGIRYRKNYEIQIWFHNDQFFMQDSIDSEDQYHFNSLDQISEYVNNLLELYPRAKIRTW